MAPTPQFINICLGLMAYNQSAWAAGCLNWKDSIRVHLVSKDESDLVSGCRGLIRAMGNTEVG